MRPFRDNRPVSQVYLAMVEDKKALRQRARGVLASLSEEQRTAAGSRIVQHMCSSPIFSECTQLFAYMPVKQEVDVSLLIDRALQLGKQVALPRCRSDYSLDFHWIMQDEADWRLLLETGPYRLLEPPTFWPRAECVQGSTLILVPALAYTRSGERLGKGKGYYDRFLGEFGSHGIRLGVAFESQIVQALVLDPHDAKVDALVTEEGLIYCV